MPWKAKRLSASRSDASQSKSLSIMKYLSMHQKRNYLTRRLLETLRLGYVHPQANVTASNPQLAYFPKRSLTILDSFLDHVAAGPLK
jgi:hypothetical protein